MLNIKCFITTGKLCKLWFRLKNIVKTKASLYFKFMIMNVINIKTCLNPYNKDDNLVRWDMNISKDYPTVKI